MDRGIIIGDIYTFDKMLKEGMFNECRSQCGVCMLNWCVQGDYYKDHCAQNGVAIVSLSEAEVKDTFLIFQNHSVNNVCLAQYGAMVYAKHHNLRLLSYQSLILNTAKELEIQYVQIQGFQEPNNTEIVKLLSVKQSIPTGVESPQTQTKAPIISQN